MSISNSEIGFALGVLNDLGIYFKNKSEFEISEIFLDFKWQLISQIERCEKEQRPKANRSISLKINCRPESDPYFSKKTRVWRLQ